MYIQDKVFKRLKVLVGSGLSRREATKQIAKERNVVHVTIRTQCVKGQGFSCVGELDAHLRSLGLDPSGVCP